MSRPEYIKTLTHLQSPQQREIARQNMKQLRERPDVQAKLKAHLASNNNPVKNPENRRKATETLRALGFPQLTGGNGAGPTVPQKMLHEALPGSIMEFPVLTHSKPPALKVDLAIPNLKLAIEVDGPSHLTQRVKQLDQKKAKILAAQGWRLLRFTNQEILRNLSLVTASIQNAIASTTSKPEPQTISQTAC